MPKKRHKPRKPGRDRNRGPQRADDLLGTVARAVRAGPAPLLDIAGMLLAGTDTRRAGGFGPVEPAMDRGELVESLFFAERVETSALLAAIAPLCGDELLQVRIRRELQRRGHALPDWLVGLDAARPATPSIVTQVLGDGDNVLLGASLPGGRELTALVYVDHNMGALVKDAFTIDESVAEVAAKYREISDQDTAIEPVDPARARALVQDAVDRWSITLGPIESETWPSCRSVVEWLAGLLPAGGTGWEFREWSEAEQTELAARFFASEFAAGLDGAAHRAMLDSILWMACAYGPGDPLRWSSTAAEIALLDRIPRKVADTTARLAVAPAVLSAFVRFAHHERGVRDELTREVLADIAEMTPEYLEQIAAPRLQGPEALLARMGVLDENTAEWFDPDDLGSYVLDRLHRAVGGAEALDALEDAPLPDEPFAWDAIPADVHDRVGEVLALVEGCCEELLDGEYRTAARRFLADVAAGDPQIFRRRAKPQNAAAAVCWTVCKANSRYGFAPVGASLTYAKELFAHFEVSASFSASNRSEAMLRAIGVDPHAQYGGMDLASPRYLVAARRAAILRERDLQRARAAELD
ncbi:MAG: DUF6398 domain-containing protein [Sporichthyaceae bacterium]